MTHRCDQRLEGGQRPPPTTQLAQPTTLPPAPTRRLTSRPAREERGRAGLPPRSPAGARWTPCPRSRPQGEFAGRGRRHSAELELRELAAGPDAELLVHVAEVVLDGPRAEEQPRGDVPVGQPSGDEQGRLPLLRSEVPDGRDVALLDADAGRAQLLTCA